LRTQFPEAFEPEAEICAVWKAGKDNSIVPDAQYCTEVDLGDWKIFDAGDSFFIKSRYWAYEFTKGNSLDIIGHDRFASKFKRLEKP